MGTGALSLTVSGMTRTAAYKLARYLQALGCRACVLRHKPHRGRAFYTVEYSTVLVA